MFSTTPSATTCKSTFTDDEVFEVLKSTLRIPYEDRDDLIERLTEMQTTAKSRQTVSSLFKRNFDAIQLTEKQMRELVGPQVEDMRSTRAALSTLEALAVGGELGETDLHNTIEPAIMSRRLADQGFANDEVSCLVHMVEDLAVTAPRDALPGRGIDNAEKGSVRTEADASPTIGESSKEPSEEREAGRAGFRRYLQSCKVAGLERLT